MSYVMAAQWRAREGKAKAVEAVLRELAAAVRAEAGNIAFTVHRSHDDPNDFLLYEVYTSEGAFAAHQQTEHFKRLVLERAVPLLAVRERRAYALLDDF